MNAQLYALYSNQFTPSRLEAHNYVVEDTNKFPQDSNVF